MSDVQQTPSETVTWRKRLLAAAKALWPVVREVLIRYLQRRVK